jgi:hypothetical protein
MNVGDEFGQIPVAVAEDRLVPALEYMSDVFVSAVIPLAVTREDPLHNAPERFPLPLYEQVNVVGHQAVGIEKERYLCLLRSYKTNELLKVVVTVEDGLPIIASIDHMIKSAFDLKPCLACHRSKSLADHGPIKEWKSGSGTSGPVA